MVWRLEIEPFLHIIVSLIIGIDVEGKFRERENGFTHYWAIITFLSVQYDAIQISSKYCVSIDVCFMYFCNI